MNRLFVALGVVVLGHSSAQAGLHYSGEMRNELPVQWRGFLIDQRSLRLLSSRFSVSDTPRRVTLMHDTYAEALLKLESHARTRTLTADEAADLGALYVRLGQPTKALDTLRISSRAHPEHFRIAANLGTAWQLAGDLEQASVALDEAVRLAPPRWKPYEQAHRKLLQLRLKEGKSSKNPKLDDLFGVAYTGEPGKPVDLPANAAEVTQQLAIWLPADGRLLWQLGEIANATGDVRTAANILDGCVTEFGLGGETIRKHRQIYRAAVEAMDAAGDHTRYRSTLKMKSSRVLAQAFDRSKLPAIQPNGTTELPWAALAETTVGRKFPPEYLEFVQKLDGKLVSIQGFFRPGVADPESNSMLLTEFPIGCWFCELPDPMGIIRVDMAQPTAPTRNRVGIEGILRLNFSDPETYLFTISDARVRRSD